MSRHNIPFSVKKKIAQNYPEIAAMGFFSNRLNNKFATAVVNKASVFEPLKVYCILPGPNPYLLLTIENSEISEVH